jgi:hypothetical protein
MKRLHKTKGGIVFETLFICAGLAFFAAAFLEGTQTYRFMHKAEEMDGSVAQVDNHGFTLEIVFKPAVATEVAFPQNGLLFNYKMGDQVPVLYDPDIPSIASLDNFSALWFRTATRLIAGIILFGIGLKMRAGRNL